MEKTKLSGIERELVLQYLIDGNVPVTITPVENSSAESDGKIHPLNSAVFPVALNAGQISVLKEGIILLKNPPKTVSAFLDKEVKVEFYFNRVGLFFITRLKAVSAGSALVIPAEINRIQDVEVQQKYDFSAVLHYAVQDGSIQEFSCVPAQGFQLFSRPVWSSIRLENQKKAKEYLELFVSSAKETGKAGNGIQLVNVCRYVAEEQPEVFEAVQGRVKPFDILFVNHERIVLGFRKNEAVQLSAGCEYDITMKFSLKSTPSITRDIAVSCRADFVYSDSDGTKFCADCSYTKLHEEDCRFLYEKATSLLFI